MTSRYAQNAARREREQANAMLLGFGGSTNEWSKSSSEFDHHAIGGPAREPVVVARVRNKICRDNLHGMHGMKRLLQVIDEDNDELLTKDEIRMGLDDLGVRLHPTELDELFEYFDPSDKGVVGQLDFLHGLRGQLNDVRARVVRLAYERFTKQYGSNATLEDMELAYDPTQHPNVLKGTSEPGDVLRDFVRQWDSLQDCTPVSEREFMEYHKNLSAALPTDAAFLSLMDGLWHLNLAGDGTNSNPALDDENRNRSNVIPLPVPVETPPKPVVSRSGLGPRPNVPDWIRFHGVTFCLSLYHKQPIQEHEGYTNPDTGRYETKVYDSYVVRTFILKYYVENKTYSVLETTGGQSKPFMSRSSLDDVGAVKLEELAVGNTVQLRGLDLHVIDADQKARAFFKEYHPDIVMPQGALPLPEEPQPRAAVQYREQPPAPRKSPAATPTRKFIENSGKILQFEGVWDDPSQFGDRHHVRILFDLAGDTVEIREPPRKVTLSGNPFVDNDVRRAMASEKLSLFTLKRQALPKPDGSGNYSALDLRVGQTIQVFGRAVQIVSCDEFTRKYYESIGAQGMQAENFTLAARYQAGMQSLNQSDGNPGSSELNVYSNNDDQRYLQVIRALRAVLEQRTQFGTEQEQRRRLMDDLRKHLPASEVDSNGGLDQDAFRVAMRTYSCFGRDTDLAFERMSSVSGQKVPLVSILDAVYPSQAPQHDIRATSNTCAIGSAGSPEQTQPIRELSVKSKALIKLLCDKLEVQSQFGDASQQKRLLRKRLGTTSLDGNTLSSDQFVGALEFLNCNKLDALELFQSMDRQHSGVVSIETAVETVIPAKY